MCCILIIRSIASEPWSQPPKKECMKAEGLDATI